MGDEGNNIEFDDNFLDIELPPEITESNPDDISDTENKSEEQPTLLHKVLQESKDKYEVCMQDFIQVSKDNFAEFDVKARETGKGYESPAFPIFSEKMEGLSTGFYIFAGPPNSGKTALMLNLAHALCIHEPNKLFLVYYSLDDSKQQVIPRVLSMRKRIPISVSAKPIRYEESVACCDDDSAKSAEMLMLREEGLRELQELAKHMLIVERKEVPYAEKLIRHAQMVKAYVKSLDPENNILVCIDSLVDIKPDTVKFKSTKEKNDYVSQLVKSWAFDVLDCPVFASHHTIKNTGGKKVSLSDLKESGEYEYDATAIFLINNDVSRNGQRAILSYEMPNVEGKMPIIEMHWAKNKASSFKERTYHYFVPNYSLVTECDKKRTEEYDNKIYSL